MPGRKLKIHGLIDPSLMMGFSATISKDGLIRSGESTFSFQKEEDSLPPGTEVKCYIGISGNFECRSREDESEDRQKADSIKSDRMEKERKRRNDLRIQAERVNSEILLPVKWTAGIKDVLSGLSEESDCNGRNRKTVQHILLLEDLSLGRISRDKRDFLCGSKGKNWSNHPEELFIDGDGKEYTPGITCKECLRVADSIRRKLKRDGD